jgi:hypothetical protein
VIKKAETWKNTLRTDPAGEAALYCALLATGPAVLQEVTAPTCALSSYSLPNGGFPLETFIAFYFYITVKIVERNQKVVLLPVN